MCKGVKDDSYHVFNAMIARDSACHILETLLEHEEIFEQLQFNKDYNENSYTNMNSFLEECFFQDIEGTQEKRHVLLNSDLFYTDKKGKPSEFVDSSKILKRLLRYCKSITLSDLCNSPIFRQKIIGENTTFTKNYVCSYVNSM